MKNQNKFNSEIPTDSHGRFIIRSSSKSNCTTGKSNSNIDNCKSKTVTNLADCAIKKEVKATAEGLVNINTASAEELCALPGIGASRAADIVRYREQNGAFQTKEDIMKVSGIKQNAYDKLCDKITVQ